MQEMETRAPDPRALMPVTEDLLTPYRLGSFSLLQIASLLRAIIGVKGSQSELSVRMSAFGFSPDDGALFCEGRDRINAILDALVGAHNRALEEDTGNPELEALKQAGKAMAEKQLAAKAAANGQPPVAPPAPAAAPDGHAEGKVIGRIEPPKTGGSAGSPNAKRKRAPLPGKVKKRALRK